MTASSLKTHTRRASSATAHIEGVRPNCQKTNTKPPTVGASQRQRPKCPRAARMTAGEVSTSPVTTVSIGSFADCVPSPSTTISAVRPSHTSACPAPEAGPRTAFAAFGACWLATLCGLRLLPFVNVSPNPRAQPRHVHAQSQVGTMRPILVLSPYRNNKGSVFAAREPLA